MDPAQRADRERRLARLAMKRARQDRRLADEAEGWRREMLLRSHDVNFRAAKLHEDLARMADLRAQRWRPRPRLELIEPADQREDDPG